MISVVLLGGGNVAHHLAKEFLACEYIDLKQVYARTLHKIEGLSYKVSVTDSISNLQKADLYIIAVSDDAVSEVSKELPKNTFVVHTSGSLSLSALKNSGRKGVFYPLQSFSKSKPIDFKQIPICIEAENDEDLNLLKQIAKLLSPKVYHISSEQRSKLHVAAVFVNNFANHMYTIGNSICEQHDVPFEVLHPLIQETASKIQHVEPKEAQTGPAIRNDKDTINRHLELLNSEQQEIYKLITKSIQNGQKL